MTLLNPPKPLLLLLRRVAPHAQQLRLACAADPGAYACRRGGNSNSPSDQLGAPLRCVISRHVSALSKKLVLLSCGACLLVLRAFPVLSSCLPCCLLQPPSLLGQSQRTSAPPAVRVLTPAARGKGASKRNTCMLCAEPTALYMHAILGSHQLTLPACSRGFTRSCHTLLPRLPRMHAVCA